MMVGVVMAAGGWRECARCCVVVVAGLLHF